MIYYILGVISGLLASFFCYLGSRKVSELPAFQRMMNTHPIFTAKVGEAYFGGLSDEEQVFKDNLPEKLI